VSTGNLSLDLLLNEIRSDAMCGGPISPDTIASIKKRFPSISDKEATELFLMIQSVQSDCINSEKASLIITAPHSFKLKAQSTKITVENMLKGAQRSITITGYSLSEYFDDLIDAIIQKSQTGVFVKFFVNDIDEQPQFEKLCRYKGRFLKIYNYRKKDDRMSALHAKVISVDQTATLITSANLSFHGQEGNIEMGTLVESKAFAKQLEDVFTQLLFAKIFTEV